ncbi:uncharacterized protein B0H18DRAFT_1128726 [Fomitopsis serialis]|uniref:uncharacterized protein n=1 Tax=Fomitopsis serialis TaxID=139415 RepID=UPI0020072936|nr:uncharacterized protein B0H18DRAFT_1128726 [Neoantrodia serialis]KAH9911407.1 hypothetical protein B0H18DRAFT_1128726 [Neoantrodia serialis]
MASLRHPARVSQPYRLSFYNTPGLTDGAKSIDLDYRDSHNLTPLGRDDSLEGIVVAVDDIESDNGQLLHEYSDSEARSSSSNADTANATNTDQSDAYDTDNEHPETVLQKVFSDLLLDPDWPYILDVQRTIELEPSDWDQLVEDVLHRDDDLYRLFSFQYDCDRRVLIMSTPTLLHEKVSNFMASIVTTRYGESYVLKVPGLQGVLSAETKREFVGPLPAPNDPSSHVRRQIGPALLVPDGAVILSFPDLLRCKNNILRSKYGEHVVGIFEKGFYEPWEHVLYRFGQYSGPRTLNQDPKDLPVFMMTIKIIEHPKYHSPFPSNKPTPPQKKALRDRWSPIEDDTLCMHDPGDPKERLTGKVTIGEHTFCGELEAYLKLQKKYEGAEEQQLKEFTSLWQTVFSMYQSRLWEKGGNAWQAYDKAQKDAGVDVYKQEGVAVAWNDFMRRAPFRNPGAQKANVGEVPVDEFIKFIEAGAVSTAKQRFETFKRECCGYSPDPPAAEIDESVDLLDESDAHDQYLKRKLEQWEELHEERERELKRHRDVSNEPESE